MSDREKVLDLIKNYIEEKITTEMFSNNFTILFSREIDYDTLSEKEYTLLSALQEMASLFSPCDDYSDLYPYRKESDVQARAKEALVLLSQ